MDFDTGSNSNNHFNNFSNLNMTFDINKVKIEDLDGNTLKVDNLGKEVGNLIYRTTSTIDWLESSKLVHKSLPVELNTNELVELIQIINSSACTLVLAIKDALLKYINEVLNDRKTESSSN